jgi:hypothetical protein
MQTLVVQVLAAPPAKQSDAAPHCLQVLVVTSQNLLTPLLKGQQSVDLRQATQLVLPAATLQMGVGIEQAASVPHLQEFDVHVLELMVQCALVLHSWQTFFVVSQNLVGSEQSLSPLHWTHLLAGERQMGVAPEQGSAVPHLHTPVVHLFEFNLQLVSTVHCLQVNVV